MKVATVSIAGERRVGQIIVDETAMAPFDLAVSAAEDCILALIHRANLNPLAILSPIPPADVSLKAAVMENEFAERSP
jgi:hypothetical protein